MANFDDVSIYIFILICQNVNFKIKLINIHLSKINKMRNCELCDHLVINISFCANTSLRDFFKLIIHFIQKMASQNYVTIFVFIHLRNLFVHNFL